MGPDKPNTPMPASPAEEARITSISGPVSEWDGDFQPDIINGMIKAVWPMVGEYSKQMLRTVVEPAVRRAVGEICANVDTFSIQYDDYTLGDKALQFGKMKVVNTLQRTTDKLVPQLRVIVIRTNIDWKSDMRVSCQLFGTMLGMIDLGLSGEMLMELVGQIPRPPFFQGVRACFLNPPRITLEVDSSCVLAKVATNLPGIKAAFINVATDELATKLVSPNRMGFRLDKKADVFRTLFPRPTGVLKLTIHRGENLVARDGHFGFLSSSDPCISVRCGAMKFKTKVISNSSNPVFDQDFYVPIHQPEEQRIEFELTGSDVARDDFIGNFDVCVADLIRQGPQEKPYGFKNAHGVPEESGKLWLHTEWRPLLLQDSTHLRNSSSGLSYLFVGVYGAKELPAHPKGTRYWVEVECTHRLGIMGTDTAKPRATPKMMVKEIVKSKEERDDEIALRQERKELCARYHITPEDMAKLLGAQAEEALESAELATELEFNRPIEFYIGDHANATADVSLKYQKPSNEHPATNNFGRLMHTVMDKHREHVDDGEVLVSGKVRLEDLLKEENSDKHIVLRRPGGEPTTLHIRMQLRSVGEPSVAFR